MPDSGKEQERAEPHRVLWNIASDLRGSRVARQQLLRAEPGTIVAEIEG